MDFGIDSNFKEVVRKVILRDRDGVEFIDLKGGEGSEFEDMKTQSYITLAGYGWLKLADYVSKDINKVLYLDTDILVTGDLMPLWMTDLGANYIAACENPWIEIVEAPVMLAFPWDPRGYKSRIGLPAQHRYFNSGMLLINLREWRKIDIPALGLAWAKSYKDSSLMGDQDMLNGLFVNRVVYVPKIYNYTSAFKWIFDGYSKVNWHRWH